MLLANYDSEKSSAQKHSAAPRPGYGPKNAGINLVFSLQAKRNEKNKRGHGTISVQVTSGPRLSDTCKCVRAKKKKEKER